MGTRLPLEAYYNAFRDGDLSIVQAYLAQPHIRINVEEINTYILTHAPTYDAYLFVTPNSCPWFMMEHWENGRERYFPLLNEAARRGHIHMIEWFFAPEQVDPFGATLAFELRGHVLSGDASMLEILLNSRAFLDYMSSDHRQSVLQHLLYSEKLDLVAHAIAYGACVNDDAKLASIASGFQTTPIVDLVVRNGTYVVGADVLAIAASRGDPAKTEYLLRHGIDWENASDRRPLRAAVSKLILLPFKMNRVLLLLEHAFVDVDERATDGETALMILARAPVYFPNLGDTTLYDTMELLLAYGADVRLTNAQGFSALDYAVQAGHERRAELLRGHGAK